jgi:hypothetical protein
MTDKLELLPCPFCGELPIKRSFRISNNQMIWVIKCNSQNSIDQHTDCSSGMIVQSKKHATKQDAINNWNTRVENEIVN